MDNKVFVVGICGSTCSGKTTFANEIVEGFKMKAPEGKRIAIIGQDSFYIGLLEGEDPRIKNYDIPEAIDWNFLLGVVNSLINRKSVQIPIYDFKTHSRQAETTTIEPVDIVIIEGILIFNCEELLPMLDLKVFINASSDLCLARRILRDTRERGRDVEGIIDQYLAHVKPSNDDLVIPSQKRADIVVNNHIIPNSIPVAKILPGFELVMNNIISRAQ